MINGCGNYVATFNIAILLFTILVSEFTYKIPFLAVFSSL